MRGTMRCERLTNIRWRCHILRWQQWTAMTTDCECWAFPHGLLHRCKDDTEFRTDSTTHLPHPLCISNLISIATRSPQWKALIGALPRTLFCWENLFWCTFFLFLPCRVLSSDCLPAPSNDETPFTFGGNSLSSIGPMRWHICSRCVELMCGSDSHCNDEKAFALQDKFTKETTFAAQCKQFKIFCKYPWPLSSRKEAKRCQVVRCAVLQQPMQDPIFLALSFCTRHQPHLHINYWQRGLLAIGCWPSGSSTSFIHPAYPWYDNSRRNFGPSTENSSQNIEISPHKPDIVGIGMRFSFRWYRVLKRSFPKPTSQKPPGHQNFTDTIPSFLPSCQNFSGAFYLPSPPFWVKAAKKYFETLSEILGVGG